MWIALQVQPRRSPLDAAQQQMLDGVETDRTQPQRIEDGPFDLLDRERLQQTQYLHVLPPCRPCLVVLPAAVVGGRSTLATPSPPAARPGPAPVPSAPARRDNAADRRPCLHAGSFCDGGQSPGCRRR